MDSSTSGVKLDICAIVDPSFSLRLDPTELNSPHLALDLACQVPANNACSERSRDTRQTDSKGHAVRRSVSGEEDLRADDAPELADAALEAEGECRAGRALET